MSYCQQCGEKLNEKDHFCSACGASVSVIKAEQEEPEVARDVPEESFWDRISPKGRRLIITGVLAVIVIISVIWCADYFSPKNRLIRNIWWTEVEIDQKYVDWSASSGKKGYATNLSCRSLAFEAWGEMTECRYGYPSIYSEGVAVLQYEITEDWNFSWYDWQKKEWTGGEWEIKENNVLYYNGKHYKWSKEESDKTWYISGKTLRIGDEYYTSEDPNID